MNVLLFIVTSQLENFPGLVKNEQKLNQLDLIITEYPQIVSSHPSAQILKNEQLSNVNIVLASNKNISGVLCYAVFIFKVKISAEQIYIPDSFYVSNTVTQVVDLTLNIKLAAHSGQFALTSSVLSSLQIQNLSSNLNSSVLAANTFNATIKLQNALVHCLLLFNISSGNLFVQNLRTNSDSGIIQNAENAKIILKNCETLKVLSTSKNTKIYVLDSQITIINQFSTQTEIHIQNTNISNQNIIQIYSEQRSKKLDQDKLTQTDNIIQNVIETQIKVIQCRFLMNISAKHGGMCGFAYKSSLSLEITELTHLNVIGNTSSGSVCGWSSQSKIQISQMMINNNNVTSVNAETYAGGIAGYISINSDLMVQQTQYIENQVHAHQQKSFTGGICGYLYSDSTVSIIQLQSKFNIIESIFVNSLLCGLVTMRSYIKAYKINVTNCSVSANYHASSSLVVGILSYSSNIQLQNFNANIINVTSTYSSYSAGICAKIQYNSTLNIMSSIVQQADDHTGILGAYLYYYSQINAESLMIDQIDIKSELSTGLVGQIEVFSHFQMNNISIINSQLSSDQYASFIVGTCDNSNLMANNFQIFNSLITAVNVAGSISGNICQNSSINITNIDMNELNILSQNLCGGIAGQIESSNLYVFTLQMINCKVRGTQFIGGIAGKSINSGIFLEQCVLNNLTIHGETNTELGCNNVNSNVQTSKCLFNGQIVVGQTIRDGTCFLVNGSC
ncbi:Hypothetical_protein [Hexamita inflata]|uniref:Hypothetical_protein n=1 Tax=Hexamita inflata TaxID=28002 RepID=A0AA86NR41_9EUKA|nr:Hypothetical protein HINF_LOCUS11483 [Hexamita inflata]